MLRNLFLPCLVLIPHLAWAQAISLQGAAQKAVLSNPEVLQRWHAYRAAQGERDAAFGGYLPRLDLAANKGKWDNNSTKGDAEAGQPGRDTQARGASKNSADDIDATNSADDRPTSSQPANSVSIVPATDVTIMPSRKIAYSRKNRR